MSLTVYTARLDYGRADRLDVTRAGADAYRRRTGKRWEGEPFAPSWAILNPALRARRAARTGDVARAAILSREQWAAYVEAFTQEMRESYRRDREAWGAILCRPEVTLCCYCTDPERCHRTILARAIFPALGATYAGER